MVTLTGADAQLRVVKSEVKNEETFFQYHTLIFIAHLFCEI